MVHQRVVAALGRNPTIGAAIKAEKRSLACLRRSRDRLPEVDPTAYGKTLAARLARLDARIEKSTKRIDLLRGLIKAMKADPKKRGANEKTVEG
jgi:hypothetical protein